jgi:hypothetical protein
MRRPVVLRLDQSPQGRDGALARFTRARPPKTGR